MKEYQEPTIRETLKKLEKLNKKGCEVFLKGSKGRVKLGSYKTKGRKK